VPQVTIGNLIFSDANNDGIFDPNIESGIDGVTVELWSNQPNGHDGGQHHHDFRRRSLQLQCGSWQLLRPCA
jgi:hypothetical protein